MTALSDKSQLRIHIRPPYVLLYGYTYITTAVSPSMA